MRGIARVVAIMVVMFASLVAYTGVAQTPDTATPPAPASPIPATGIAQILPTEDQVPIGLEIIDDGERTLQDVTSGFSDPEEATEMFEEWGWQRNVIRAFHTPAGAETGPNEIDGIYISIHELGSPDAAAEALDYSADIHQASGELVEQGHEGLGDSSRVLFGEETYGNEITIYAQQGNVLIRLSANSPEGDPTEEAFDLMSLMLEDPYFEQ